MEVGLPVAGACREGAIHPQRPSQSVERGKGRAASRRAWGRRGRGGERTRASGSMASEKGLIGWSYSQFNNLHVRMPLETKRKLLVSNTQ